MDSVIDESIAMRDDVGVDAPSYTWVVDNAIRSDTASYWGAASVHSFGSVVDRAIRSDTASNFDVRSTIAARSSKLEVIANATPGHVAASLSTLAKLEEATNNFSLNKQGSLVGRAIDLSRLSGYNDLLSELERLFGMEGLLKDPAKRWRILYTDHENDILVVGDDPWEEFCNVVSKIHIYTQEEVEKMTGTQEEVEKMTNGMTMAIDDAHSYC